MSVPAKAGFQQSINRVFSSASPEPQLQSTETVIELFEACLESAARRSRLLLDHYRLHGNVPKKFDWQSPSPSQDAPVNTDTFETSSKAVCD